MAKATSINIKPAKIKTSEAHNERRVKLDYILPGHDGQHEHWKPETISERQQTIHELYHTMVGQKMQQKAEPIREGVVVIKPETTMDELRKLGDEYKERFGFECFQIHIHRDEGHIVTEKEARSAKALGNMTVEPGMPIINHHAHMILDWQNKTTGRSIKLNKDDMREMQTMTAEVLDMERGQPNSKATRLEAKEFKVLRQKLNEDADQELEVIEKRKLKALKEVEAIEDQKKKLLPGLRELESEMKKTSQSFEGFKTTYNQTVKELQYSREKLKKLEPKNELQSRLEALPWKDYNKKNVQWWLALTHGFHGIKVKSGQDGSIYFDLAGHVARVKDMPKEVQAVIKKILSADPVFQRSEAIKWRKYHRQSGQ